MGKFYEMENFLSRESGLSGLSRLSRPGKIAENWAFHPVRFRYGTGPVRFLYPNEIAKAFHPVHCVTGQVGQAG